MAFESALAGAGLTENAAWTYDLDHPLAEQRQAAWLMLRDLLLDMRKGKYGPEGKFGRATLAKRPALAVETVEKLNASADSTATSPVAQHPALTDEDRYILIVLDAHAASH